jgi:hypothetical protein
MKGLRCEVCIIRLVRFGPLHLAKCHSGDQIFYECAWNCERRWFFDAEEALDCYQRWVLQLKSERARRLGNGGRE